MAAGHDLNMTAKSTIKAIGADSGGTWTRITAFDARMRPVRRARFKTGEFRSLPAKLLREIGRWPGAELAPLVIASRGVFSRKWKKPFLVKALSGKLNLAAVISDAEAAHFAAFSGKAGTLLLAGTGAVVFCGKPGAFAKIGGHNPPSGDPGSGRWLGRQYLKRLGRLREAAAMGHGRTAAYAAKLLARAQKGHRACALLAEEAARELAALLRTAAGPGARPVKAALAGGLMESGYFRETFVRTAGLVLGKRRLVFIKAEMTAEEAAARLSLLRRRTT